MPALHRFLGSLLVSLLILTWADMVQAQIDPERRTNIEAGIAKAVRGNGPLRDADHDAWEEGRGVTLSSLLT